jgi:predicted phosphodiesterase
MDSIAVVSDIHGNRWALEAVLADIDSVGISTVVNLGDVVYGPLDPRGTADLVLEREIPTVRGNEDRIVVDGAHPVSETLRFVRCQLDRRHLAWLETLETCLTVGPMRAFHGSPRSDTEYLLREVRSTGSRRRGCREVQTILGDTESSLVACGHDHLPGLMVLANGTTVVNPGSVGLPAYRDDEPHPHAMETGSPHAHYSVISEARCGISVTDRAVAYDWQSAAEVAESNGRPDWAWWLRTGRTGCDLSKFA